MTRTKLIGLLLVAIMALSAVAGAAPADDLDFGDDSDAPNPYIDVDTMTVAEHPMEQGTSKADVEGYYDDNGDWVNDTRWKVNTTMNKDSGDNVNPYTYDPAKVIDDDYGAFPRTNDGDNDASALDSSEYSTDASGGGSISVSDTTIASGVDSVQISASSQSTDSDVVVATYNNWTSELDSDEDKRVLQIGGEVNSINSGARVEVEINDESGDTKSAIIEPDASGQTANASVIATGTGTFTDQVKLSDLSTSGGGTWDNIESIKVKIHDNTADVSFSWIDLADKTKTDMGTQNVDDDSDGTYDETSSLHNSTGTVDVRDLGSLGQEYDDASLVDLQFPAKYPASELRGDEAENGTYLLSWDSAEQYVGYDDILNVTYRMNTTGAIDLTHSGMDLQWEQDLPSDRYVTAGDESSFGSETNLSTASVTGPSLGSPGDVIDFDNSVTAGTYYAVKYEVKLTANESSAIQSTDDGGAAAPPDSGDSGGIIGFVTSIPGMFLTAVTGFFGFRWLRRRLG